MSCLPSVLAKLDESLTLLFGHVPIAMLKSLYKLPSSITSVLYHLEVRPGKMGLVCIIMIICQAYHYIDYINAFILCVQFKLVQYSIL